MQILLFPEAEAISLQKLAWCQRLFARVSWPAWVELVAPYYDAAVERRGACCTLDVMLRIHFVQQYLGLSDPAMACTLKNHAMVRRLVGLTACGREVPDETAILSLRRLLELHGLAEDDLDSAGMLFQG